jgi:Uma2 family endonuclease
MSAVPKKKYTEAEYLAIERAAEFKSEFYNGEMFAMAGATYDHNRVKDNLASALNQQGNGGPCFALTSDMKVKVGPTSLYAYPDIVVVCGSPDFLNDTKDTLLNPAVVIEVLSPSTEKYDRGAKFRHYQQVPSLREIVLVAQDEPVCERFVRQPDGTWNLATVTRLEDELIFITIPARVRLSDIYSGVTFPETPGR